MTEIGALQTVTSNDGTTIAYDRIGSGPPVILVDGAFGSRTFGPNPDLAPVLAEHFTVYSYDRRGRGGSGDTLPWDAQREVEDLEAMIRVAGGSASVYGISSGAALALEAANRGAAIDKLALYEVPFVVDDTRKPIPDGYLAQLQELVDTDRRGAAIKLFMTTGIGLPGFFVGIMQLMPAWSKLKKVAHTVPYDATLLGGNTAGRPLPTDRWTSVTMPTLVLAGSKSPEWMRNGMRALAGVLPNATLGTLDRQTHLVKAKVLGPALVEFFAG